MRTCNSPIDRIDQNGVNNQNQGFVENILGIGMGTFCMDFVSSGTAAK